MQKNKSMLMDRPYTSRALILCILCSLLLMFSACGSQEDVTKETETASEPILENCSIEHETEFGGIYIQQTIEAFNALGFEYGDSVDISFSNGYEMEDQPYYNGYYTQAGESLLVAYPGYPYICAKINNGDDLWDIADVSDDDTATVTLHEAGKYRDIQEARDLLYSDDRDQFESDKVFANFRRMKEGGMKNVYRSASPTDNQHNRAPYVQKLAEGAGINFILDLADTEERIQQQRENYDFQAPYFTELLERGDVALLGLNVNYGSQKFRNSLADGLRQMGSRDGPYLIHCTEGKDRTGFVCMLLEALVGASYDEIREDYMITYGNYYGITKESDPGKYYIIVRDVMDPMLGIMAGQVAFDKEGLQSYAEQYLKTGGMSECEIENLRSRITK